MKHSYAFIVAGILLGPLALGGCSSTEKAAAAKALANVILTSGSYNSNDGSQPTVSAASADTTTSGTVTDEGSGTFSVAVNNGGAVAGPRTFEVESYIPDSAFAYAKPTDGPDNSILVVGAFTPDAYAGFVAGYTDAGMGVGPGNIAAGFGGITPTTLPTGVVRYGGSNDHPGSAVGVYQTAGEVPSGLVGGIEMDADFLNGTVNGQIGFDGDHPVIGDPVAECCQIAFAGNMSTDHATYASNTVVFNNRVATGSVLGGFYGPTGSQTAGAFNVQDTGVGGTGSKLTGSFVGSSEPLPP